MPEPVGSSSSRTTAPTSTLVIMNSLFLVNILTIDVRKCIQNTIENVNAFRCMSF